ncbi:hydrogenase [Candidatus Bathyarchaeota archaeon]|nr:hydrogenase [Candidatus Bathyarchaeota archaeon]
MPPGKIPKDILEEVVFKNLGIKRKEVILGPSAGIDGAVIDLGNKSLITAMDPITGALERIGWLAVNINANDVATFGAEPMFFLSCILLPEKTDRKIVETICTQMDKDAKELGIAIIGGHCEVTPELPNPIVIGCTMSVTEKGNYVTAGGAKPGDKLLFTKSAGIEGTAILAADREKQLKRALVPMLLESAKNFYCQISVVKDAITAFKTGGVTAMHDPTEGGIFGGIHEMADASRTGVRISESEILIAEETTEICKFFKIDPLQLMSSGALLIAVKPNSLEKTLESLKKQKIGASVIGEFLKSPNTRLLMRKDGKETSLVRPEYDHLWQALQKKL